MGSSRGGLLTLAVGGTPCAEAALTDLTEHENSRRPEDSGVHLGASRKTGLEGAGSGKDFRLPTLGRVMLIALLLL